MIEWISKNVTLLTLLVTTVLMIITLVYTLITRKMLRLSSQPTIRIKTKNISIIPDIPDSSNIGDAKDDLGDERYCITVDFELANIGSHPAQNIYFDAEAHFKERKPLGKESLPVHLPEFINFLSPEIGNQAEKTKVSARFDNFLAREVIRDFFKGRTNLNGLAFLPSEKEIQDRKLWPSPKLIIKCFYADIQGQNYISELRLFFHIWKDTDKKKFGIYLLNMQELEFIGVRKISKRNRENYIKNSRHLRYIAFSGEKYAKKDLLLLSAKRKAV